MGSQNIVVIQDAEREVNLRIFDWALHVLSLKAGDKLTLVIVLHQVITPMGYRSSVDRRHMMGANQKIIEAEVAKKKEKYLRNEKLSEFFKLYKSKKVEFTIEVATGSSPRAVALKIAMKLNATWVMLDRKMKKDEDYFLQKLSCKISRLRRYNRITHLRGRPDSKDKQDSTREIYAESIPVSANSSNEEDPVSTESLPNSGIYSSYYHQMKKKEGNHHDEAGCSSHTFDSDKAEETSPDQSKRNQIHNTSKKLADVTCDGSNKGTLEQQKSQNTKLYLYEKSEEHISYCGAKSFYLGKAEEYKACEQIFSLFNLSG